MRAPSANSNPRTFPRLSLQIRSYSLTAAAAGVGILALVTPAEGEVIFTKKTIPIPLSSLGVEGVGISFANNGVDDLKLVLSSFSIFGNNGNILKAVNDTEGQGVVGEAQRFSFPEASALTPGREIGANAHFVSAPGCNGTYFSYCGVELAATHTSTFGSRNIGGPWAGTKTAYLGVRFLIDGETHYGWVRLTVNTSIRRRTMATVTAYAYETEANQPIYAGFTSKPVAEVQAPEKIQNQPGPSLGMLALGAEGVPLWRRKEALTSSSGLL